MKNNKETQDSNQKITRKEAINKIGNYGKYAALTALGTYMILNQKKHKLKAQKHLGQDFN